MKIASSAKFLSAMVMMLLLAAQACVVPPTAQPSPTLENTPVAEPTTEQPTSPPATDTPEPTETAAAATPTIPGDHQNPSVTPSYIQMFDETNGWGLTDQFVLRTTDGGHQWINVSPEGGFAPGSFLYSFFLDANTGWVLPGGSEASETGTLYRTDDGGQTWEPLSTPFGNGQFYFIDPQNGWVMVSKGAAAGSSAVDIHHTTDGGNTWTLVHSIDPTQPEEPGDLPFAGTKNGLAFRDQTHGWVTGTQPTEAYAWLFATQDGGQTWQHQDLTIPEEFETSFVSIDPPRFFTDQEGILPVNFFTDTGALVFYNTLDGGATWNATTPVQASGPYSLASMQDFWVWDGTVLHASHDGGQTWTEITPNPDLGENITQLDFVSSTTGWAVSTTPDQESQLYQTTDGGETWELLS